MYSNRAQFIIKSRRILDVIMFPFQFFGFLMDRREKTEQAEPVHLQAFQRIFKKLLPKLVFVGIRIANYMDITRFTKKEAKL